MGSYRKLMKQPLVFVLAEFRFSPVLKIGQYIPDLQEALRKTYPLPETLQDQSVQVKPDGIAINRREKWAFIDSDRLSAITIDQDRLIYFTRDYPRFGGFSEQCLAALGHLKNTVDPDLLLRIGLRYGDCIRIAEGETLEDYVDEYFGYPRFATSLGEPEQQRDEIGIKTAVGRMLIRSYYGKHPFVCLPDIQGIPGIPGPDDQPSERILLDFDHFWVASESPTPSFELSRIEALLSELHATLREAFWKMTTDEAKDTKWS